jgi:hypothetical protein
MSTRLGPLRDYYGYGLHLTDHLRARTMDSRREWSWDAERQHDSGGLMSEYAIQEFGVLR